MTKLNTYFASGLTSGWTSGLLSGYAPTIISADNAGILHIKARPLDAQGGTGRITVAYCATSEIPIVVWEETIGTLPNSLEIYRILLKGGWNEKGTYDHQG